MAIAERTSLQPEELPAPEADPPDWPVAAAMIAGGVGAAAVGFSPFKYATKSMTSCTVTSSLYDGIFDEPSAAS